MTPLATIFPDDLWGSKSRNRARSEVSALAATKATEKLEKQRALWRQEHAQRHGGWQCRCRYWNAKSFAWCNECGVDKP